MMTIELKNVVPIPLKDQLLRSHSQIWNQQILMQSGQWIKIKAPSGTGKTTLVHTLYKLRQDHEGAVLWNGIPLKKLDAAAVAVLRQSSVSIVFQDLRLFPNLTARENIELKRVMHGPYCEAVVIDEMADELGVTHILNQQAGICSYGEQQRVAIIRALMQPFEWLIMDEPFSHLDQSNQQKAIALLKREISKRGAGMIITDLDDDQHFAYTHEFTL